jgi:hypothetical protein
MMKHRAGFKLFTTAMLLGVGIGATVNAQEAPTAEQLAAMAERAAQLGLPEGVIQISPCVPTMGEHWANPDDMPLGPIYGVMNDEVVFVELMPAQADFAEGKSWHEVLVPPAGQTIHHVDFDYLPQGHEGYEVPHYDIHAYFVPHDEHMAFCPPDAAGADAGEAMGSH